MRARGRAHARFIRMGCSERTLRRRGDQSQPRGCRDIRMATISPRHGGDCCRPCLPLAHRPPIGSLDHHAVPPPHVAVVPAHWEAPALHCSCRCRPSPRLLHAVVLALVVALALELEEAPASCSGSGCGSGGSACGSQGCCPGSRCCYRAARGLGSRRGSAAGCCVRQAGWRGGGS